MKKPKLLLIEDNDEDAQIAIQSLNEAGEDFDYTQIKTLSEALWQLESSPKGTYQKIYLDLGLKDVRNRISETLKVLSQWVGRDNIIVVHSDPSKAVEIQKAGSTALAKSEVLDTNVLANFVFGLQQQDKQRSIQRHRDLANLEIKIAKLEIQLNHNKAEIELMLTHAKSEDGRVIKEIDRLKIKLDKIESSQLELFDQLDELAVRASGRQALHLKKFEVRWQLAIAIVAALCAAIAPKLLETLKK